MPLRLYFIRHGETEWSHSGQYSGRTDISLTAHGEDEARAVGKRLRDIPFAHVLTSPLQRAQQTCALAALGPTPKIEPNLAEWDNGDDEGRTSEDILKSRPRWSLFRDGSPNGETHAQISDRVDRFIAQVRVLDGNVALFSHSHFGRVLAARWIGLPVEQGSISYSAPRQSASSAMSMTAPICRPSRSGTLPHTKHSIRHPIKTRAAQGP